MCDNQSQILTEEKPSTPESNSPDTASAPEKPKVCNCEKPCCRNKLIEQAATSGNRQEA